MKTGDEQSRRAAAKDPLRPFVFVVFLVAGMIAIGARVLLWSEERNYQETLKCIATDAKE
ncbi:MAG: hypothetical protein NTU94_13795 [Planctomycetota bacterium]|nr:hypothetical protein [Planctomycetota bacterium]